MKKNLTRILLAVMSLVVSFAAVSCGDNDEDEKEIFVRANLIGKWYLSIATGFMIDDYGIVSKFADIFTKDDAQVFMTFHKSGDLFMVMDEKEAGLKWKINGEELELTNPTTGNEIIYTIKELSPATLKYQAIIYDVEGKEYVNNYTCTKIIE